MKYLGIVLLVLCSAFFSGSEIAYASLNKLRLKQKHEKSPTITTKIALYISESYDKALSTILIGNNLVNIASSSLATVIVIDLLGEGYAWLATVAMTLILLIFGEITPKVIAKQFCDSFSLIVAIPLKVLLTVFAPLNALVTWLVGIISKLWKKNITVNENVTEEDLENIIEIVESEGVLEEERCDLLQNALEFDDVLAYEVVTPRVDMVSIDIDDDFDEQMETILASPHSRLPVYRDTVDNIIGILHLNHFFKELLNCERPDIEEIMLSPVFVHKTMPLPDVLDKMKENKIQLVVVSDEYGGTMGILTAEDVLEQLVGEIWDESDEVIDEFAEISEDTFEADGDMRIYDFFDELDMENVEFDDDSITVGGWVTDMLEGECKVGSSFTFQNLEITIIEVSPRRVDRISVKVLPIPDEDDEEEEDLL